MTSTNPENLRRHRRVETAVQLRFQIENPPPSMAHLGYIDAVTRNVSEGGVFIELGRQQKLRDDAIGNFLLLKSVLDMEIRLAPLGTTVRVKGKAVWIEKKVPGKEKDYCRGVAVQFTEVQPPDAASIRAFVDSFPQTA